MTYRIIFILFTLLLANQAYSQQYAERMLYRETYSSKNINTLKVINKHGSIKVKNWDKDSIKISTDLYISATTTKKLDKLKKSIQIKYNKSEYDIIAQTFFTEGKMFIISDLQNIGNSISPIIEKRIEINYEIFLPEGIELKITNQYGDILLGKMNNKLNINLSNGLFKAYDLPQKAMLTFSFVDAMINDAKEINFDLKYSTVNMNKAINLDFESRSSELKIENLGVLKLESYRDKINIDELDYVYGNANYTNINLTKLNKELDGHFSYGKINIDKIATTSTLINIDSERTDIKLFIPKKISYNYNILYHTDASLMISEKNSELLNSNDTGEIKSIKGKFGTNPTLDLRIRAIKKCIIQIMNISE